MEKERSNFELWLIVQSNFERIYDTLNENKGLCNVINILAMQEFLITWSELIILKRIINDYKKKRGKMLDAYIWEKDARKPRRLFVHRQILKEIRKSN